MQEKQKLIFFDTETTGNEQKDFLVQIAYKIDDESFAAFYKPEIKIPPEVSAIHHITNKMVENRPAFRESNEWPKIKKLFEDKNSIVVAHNAPFDLMMVKKEGIEPKKFICTLRMVRYLDKENKMAQYKLQYLRYLLDLDVEATAHDALGDVLVLEKLFEYIKNKITEEMISGSKGMEITDEKVVEKMIEISSHPSLLRIFNFGKHNGKKIDEVTVVDRKYLEWLLAQKLAGDQIDEDWIYTLKHYLEK